MIKKPIKIKPQTNIEKTQPEKKNKVGRMETEKATNLFGVPLVICTILGAKFTL